jgi:hypothetical protein
MHGSGATDQIGFLYHVRFRAIEAHSIWPKVIPGERDLVVVHPQERLIGNAGTRLQGIRTPEAARVDGLGNRDVHLA